MNTKQICVSAPGSIMLLGEHAVLRGYPAVVGAINRRIKVTLIPRTDRKIKIVSALLGEHSCELDAISVKKPFQFVTSALQSYQAALPSGFELQITAEFSDKVGFGSSAAVTAATVAAIEQWLCGKADAWDICLKAIDIIRSVQGIGSGADVAASVFGGVLLYWAEPIRIEKLAYNPPINLIYVGYKTPTVTVINRVKELAAQQPEHYAQLFAGIGKCVLLGARAIQQQNWAELGRVFVWQQTLQKTLGTSDATIDKIITNLANEPAVLGAKISGSGLGDCVVVLGEVQKQLMEGWISGIRIEACGLRIEG